ncbi:unnamed protein product [Rotaria sp. Silwood2]|nr:unnamed protein product [Rotaria sp. Silwood2]
MMTDIKSRMLFYFIILIIISIIIGQQQQQQQHQSSVTIVVLIDYHDPLLKYHLETLIADYEQEWIISSIYLQTNTKLNIETITYQSRYQLKLLEKLCQHLNSTNYLFAITHFRYQSPVFVHGILSQMHIPHMAVSMTTSNATNSYTLHMQTSSEHLSMAIRDIIDHFKWGYDHSKLLFVYEKYQSLGLLSDILRVKNNRQPAIILKALTVDSKESTSGHSILAELRNKADPSKQIIIALSQKSLDEFLMNAQNLGIVSIYYHLLIVGVDARQLNWTHFYESGVQLTSIQLVPNKSIHTYESQQGLMKDALDTVKYILRKLLFDNEYEKERLIPQQECSWKKLFTANSYTTFTQHIGETLLEISKTIKFLGTTGIVDFDQAGFRRSLKLKILDLSDHGMTEIGTWTNTNRLSINQLSVQQMSAIRKHLQVVTREEKPYVVRKVHRNGSVYFEGYCIDMLDEIARRLRFNYSIRIATDSAYGKEEENGQWSGIIGELSRRTADLGIGALTITYPREQVIDFTKPFMSFGITILFRKPLRPRPNLFAFLEPLTVQVWLFMSIAYIGVSLFLFSMARFSPYEWQSPYSCKRHSEYLINRFNIVNCFWFTIGSLMKQTIDYGPRSLSTRVLIGSWWFFSLIMIASYTANLAAFLTTERLKSPIDDIEALAKQTEIKYGPLKGGSTEQFFRSSKIPLYERMWYYMSSRPEVFPETTEEGIEWVKKSKYAFLLESATNEYNVQRHCELMQVGGLIESKSYGIGTTHGSPYRDRISNEIFDIFLRTTSTSSLTMPTSSESLPIAASPDTFNIHNNDYEDLDYRPITREIMSAYLSSRHHRTVTIYHAKVAQKSYGNEKRFFCPPPCVYLSGDGWNSNSDKSCCSSSLSSLYEQEHLCAMIGISEPLYSNEHENYLSNEMQKLSIENGNIKYGSAKTLFISDTDKRKYINLNIKIIYTDNYHSNPYVGLFQSQKIKVISKPSKKKQSIKNAELCIQSGTKIALFNRLRSQNVSTRFLHVDENKQFHASAHEWGSFYIHLVDNDDLSIESNQFSVKEGFIQYGSTVKLVCSITNQSLPYLIIRKVEKNRILIDSDEPVSQLHKCAFEFKNHPSNFIYLSLVNERIVAITGKSCINERFRVDINDAACWTIISTDKAEYTWFEARGPVAHPITPVPIARHIVVDGGGTAATIELNGENFIPGLSVWFGETESPCTEYRSSETMVAEVPQFSSLMPNMSWIQRSISTPIVLVRRDGVIYLTSLIFIYTPQSATIQKISTADDIIPSKSESDFCE